MSLSHIVAMADNGTIGAGGQLPWHIPEDFKIFRRLTTGHAMIMGRKTFESIGKPLPGRLSIVVTRQANWPAPAGVIVCGSLEEALAAAAARRQQWGGEVFIIGGGELFQATLDIVDTIYQTVVHMDVTGDTSYPQLPAAAFMLERTEAGSGPVPFTWKVWKRRTAAAS